MKLHIGSGKIKIPGYTNVDIDPDNNPDIISNGHGIPNIEDNTVSEIYACHVLEHFARKYDFTVLTDWFILLNDDGILRVCVPDFASICHAYTKYRSMELIMGLLYGGQKNQYDYHKIGFDFASLKHALSFVGFKHIFRYDYQDFPPNSIDDYSNAFLPHMNKDGLLMSLNVIAFKSTKAMGEYKGELRGY